MQLIPPLAAQSPNGRLGRRHGERDHEHERQHPQRDVDPLENVLGDRRPVKELVEHGVDAEVPDRPEERGESKKTSLRHQPAPARESHERRDRQRSPCCRKGLPADYDGDAYCI